MFMKAWIISPGSIGIEGVFWELRRGAPNLGVIRGGFLELVLTEQSL